MEITHNKLTFVTSDNNVLNCDIKYVDNSLKKPVVIVVHGFKGFKDWGSMHYICDKFCLENYFVVSFNFSHNGINGHETDFTQLDKFKKNTFSLEIEELLFIVNLFLTNKIGSQQNYDPNNINLVGHSRGGGIVILATSRVTNIKKIAIWGGVSTFERYSERQKQTWRETGVFKTKNMRTGQIMELGIELLNDLEQNSESLNILKNLQNINSKIIFIHGEQDIAVNLKEAHQLYNSSIKANTILKIIPNTGHTFGAVHPFSGSNISLDSAINQTLEFLKNNKCSKPIT